MKLLFCEWLSLVKIILRVFYSDSQHQPVPIFLEHLKKQLTTQHGSLNPAQDTASRGAGQPFVMWGILGRVGCNMQWTEPVKSLNSSLQWGCHHIFVGQGSTCSTFLMAPPSSVTTFLGTDFRHTPLSTLSSIRYIQREAFSELFKSGLPHAVLHGAMR